MPGNVLKFLSVTVILCFQLSVNCKIYFVPQCANSFRSSHTHTHTYTHTQKVTRGFSQWLSLKKLNVFFSAFKEDLWSHILGLGHWVHNNNTLSCEERDNAFFILCISITRSKWNFSIVRQDPPLAVNQTVYLLCLLFCLCHHWPVRKDLQNSSALTNFWWRSTTSGQESR